MIITREKFIECVGREPELDDLERCNCPKVGEPGHWSCGWCSISNLPRYECESCFCGTPHEEEDKGISDE